MKKVKHLTRLAYLIVAAFCIFIGYKHIHDIYLLKSNTIQENLQRTFTHLKNDLEYEVSNAKINLSLLEVIVLRRINGQIPFKENDFETIMSPLISTRDDQFNIYFALNRELSQKFFKAEGAAYTVSKNKELLNSKEFNNPRTFITKVYRSPHYHEDTSEVWYHAAKKSRSFEISDIYFDKNYLQVWMYSIVKGIYQGDKFLGVVGIDFYLDSFLKMINETATELKGSLFLIDNNTKKIFTQSNSDISTGDIPPELLNNIIGQKVINHKIELSKNGKKYLLNSFPLSSFRWTVVALTNVDQLYQELEKNIIIMISLGFIILLINLVLTNYIFKILNRTYLEIVANNQSKSILKMTESLCHEINNPLATLSLSLSSIRRTIDNNSPAGEMIHRSENAVTRIEMLVHKLKNLSFPDESIKMRHISLNEIIEELKIIFSEDFQKYHIRFSYHSQTDDVVYCDSLKLIQVFLALMENSIEEIKNLDERWIKIDHKSNDKESVIKFSDSGLGIKEDLHQRIFLPFFTTKSNEMKKGLGLSIAQRIIEKQGGKLRLDSDARTTTFRINLPHEKNS